MSKGNIMITVKLHNCQTWLLWVTLLYAVASAQKSEFRCKTPSGKEGVCRKYNDCNELKIISMKPSKSCQDYKTLWDSKCSEKSDLFCCSEPECYTPDGIPGKIVPLTDCPELYEMVQKNINFVYNSMSTAGGSFCCGLKPRPAIERAKCTNMDTAFPPDSESLCCGIEAKGEDKIIGGTNMSLDEYPWLAILNYQKQNKNCGGSLISSRYVLTAAHCTFTDVPISVTLGEYNKTTAKDCIYMLGKPYDCADDPVTIKVQHVLNHNYNPTDESSKDDISLIRLEKSVPYTDFIRPICLPTVYPDIVETSASLTMTTAGWGVSDDHETSDVKLKVDLPLVHMADCAARLNRDLWGKQMCAGGVRNKDSCSGDSGGPLMFKTRGQHHILGIVSFGSKECGDGRPAVYTRVSSYNTWIYRNIKA